eukprot:1131970-Lingulodinium_polyedra.AAC.1
MFWYPRRASCVSLRGFALVAVHAHRSWRAERQSCCMEALRRPLGRGSPSAVLLCCQALCRAWCARRVPDCAAMVAVPSIVPPTVWARCTAPS